MTLLDSMQMNLQLLRDIWRHEREAARARILLAEQYPLVQIDSTALVRAVPPATITIGAGTAVSPWTVLLAQHDCHPGAVPSALVIGESTYIGEGCNLRAAGGQIGIGSHVLIAQGVHIIASNHSIELDTLMRNQPWDTGTTGVVVEDNVWIGCNVVLLPGTHLRTGSVVAAGAVVKGIVAQNSIVGGIPARELAVRGAPT